MREDLVPLESQSGLQFKSLRVYEGVFVRSETCEEWDCRGRRRDHPGRTHKGHIFTDTNGARNTTNGKETGTGERTPVL